MASSSLGQETSKKKINLLDTENLVQEYINNIFYSSAWAINNTRGQDVAVSLNELELSDDLIGLFDSMKHYSYYNLEPGLLYNKP